MKYNYKKVILIILSALFLAAFNILLSFLIQQIIDSVLLGSALKKIVIFLSLLLFFSILYPLIYDFNIKLKKILSLSNKEDILNSVIDKQMSLKLSSQEKVKESDYLMLVNEDLENYSGKLSNCYIPLLQHSITIIIALIYGFYYSYKISLVVILLVAIYHLVNNFVLSKMILKKDDYLKKVSNSKQFLFNTIENIPIFRILGIRQQLKNKIQKYISEEIKKKQDIVHKETINNILGEAPIQAIEFVVFLLGIYYNLKGDISFGVVVGLWNGLIGSILWSSVELPYIYQELSSATASEKRVKNFLNTSSYTMENTEDIYVNNNSILIKDLEYKFNETNKIIKYQDYIFENKGIYLITGKSGAGKSTMAKLLAGLYVASKGKVIKDKNIKVSYVPQNSEIFPLSIKENILLGETKYSVEDINIVLEKVRISKAFINEDRTIDDIIDSEKISGGEAQRINIARAIIRESQYIIMDEPFSSLDYSTAMSLISTIKELSVSYCFIIVTHLFVDEFKEFKNYKVGDE